MTYQAKGAYLPPRKSKIVAFDRFQAVDSESAGKNVLVASAARNCDFENGALRSGFGAKRYYLEFDKEKQVAAGSTVYGNPKMVFTALVRSTSDGLLKRVIGAQTGVNRIFAYDPDGEVVKHISMPKNLLEVVSYVYPDGAAKIIFCCADQLFTYDFTNKVTKIATDTFTCARIFHERLLVSTKNALRYSAPMDVAEFSPSFNGGGEIKFEDDRGEIVWLEALGEELYVFFQYGIARLSATGEGSEFALEDVPYNGGRILPRTVCTYENKLVFASFDGLFVFDGKRCSKVENFKYSPLKNDTISAYGALVGSRYFTYYVDADGVKRSAFIDLKDEKNACDCFTLYGLNQSGGYALCSCDYVYSYLDRDGDLPNGEKYLFEVASLDFGSSAEKALGYLTLQCAGECEVTIQSRSGKRTVVFDLASGEDFAEGKGTTANGSYLYGGKRVRIGLKGREFSLSITLKKGCVIKKMTFEYDELGGVE